ncbi:S41 family peptidase [uncultured Sphingomonas sp.]|uniref:S41 family peptidase n=1 Tax=uncultured Sphingomonas sp. TaxID=158754 RepID=UPI0035CAFEDE
MRQRLASLAAIMAMLSSCGGGSGSGAGTGSTATSSGATGTTTAGTGCTLRERQDWAFAQLNQWYLFPETLPTSLDPTPYTTVGDYIDALTATARSQRRDRYFTYLTSISSEDAYYASGSSAGFGVRLTTDAAAGRVFIAEAFEGAPALAAGIDRGTEILAIGTSASDLKSVSSIIATAGTAGVTDALGPSTAGTTRLLRVTDANGQRDVTVAKADYSLTPVSSRYGAKIITDGGRQVGYINLRTFISTADPALRQAFGQFKAAGVTDVIIDLRYNGGGLVSISELIGDLLGGARSTSDVLDYTTFRPEKAANNSTRFFQPTTQSIAPTRIAFIGTGGTASASELTINAQIPYLHANAALIGTNTFGKPVGQIALDRAACDDRLRVIAFATQNANRQGNYFDGLATVVEASCQAADDLNHPLGDPQEGSTRAALNFIEGVACTKISSGEVGTESVSAQGKRTLLTPDHPDTAQRETPGLF